ncbi:succinate dehydrogenase/fumarate reductase iron-sulfur subunit [Natronorubrum bangense]|uniref:Succinate dehydrogenase and fumarate reductase iron-sulfur protein n=2 Tax=Natronorubrum bangense TaxID=61858 RepID=L9WF05_9EURY|nr:succinate dehydrogenase/fumarate reductase iron-sulfur subunit [Natronorubrum bangense]ELY48019.1 succinate dehydrogenase and fumarate reductase iron-sulfur protein [Natronorubrum bangense JCM 10635]QCC53524.1 succinate dehydrogenase/fumarate reductase iron-sulfur subunit [Natronorubrum bangense]
MSTQQQKPETQESPEDPEMKGAESPQQERLKEKESSMVDEQSTADPDADEETVLIKVFRYDPEVADKQEPRFDDFHVPFKKGMTVLDAVMYARDTYDSSLTFRHSCRQAVCGSDAFFVNGKQRLGCKTQISELEHPVRIEPLPHQEVVKDLVVDMDHFYDQMHTVEPYFQSEDTPDASDLEEQRQTRENREKVKMSTRCIWCGACMSSCNIAAGDNDYLGPAAINKAYRFAMDDREEDDIKEHRLRILEQEQGVWRCQTQFSCTEVCPKDIPLTEHIQELKREAVKKNLKFW